jgi:hypothetical protein
MKPKANWRITQSTQDELKKEAKKLGKRSAGSHVDELLTKHISKQEFNHLPKKETI